MRRTKQEAEATRAAVLQAALEVFSERGYGATTLDEVAQRASVTRGAAYHPFTGKADLFLSMIKEYWAAADAALWIALQGNDPPLTRVRRFLVRYLNAAESDERLRRLLEIVTIRVEAVGELDAGLQDEQGVFAGLLEEITYVATEARRRGELREDMTPRGAATLALSMLIGVIRTWLLSPDLLRPTKVAILVADAWVRS